MSGVAGKGGGSALSKIQVICCGAPPADAVLYKASQMGKVTTPAVAMIIVSMQPEVAISSTVSPVKLPLRGS